MRIMLYGYALALVIAFPMAVSAHPVLKDTAPKADAQVVVSPSEIRLTFSESLMVKFSGIELKDQNVNSSQPV